MTIDELGALLRQHQLIFLSLAPAPNGGWQASSRVAGSAGYTTYVTKGDTETLEYAISRVVPDLGEKPAEPEEDIFG